MPGVAPDSSARILEWLELEPRGRDAYRRAVAEEPFAVGRYQMRHRPPFPDMPMQPQTAVHGVNHSLAP